MGIGCWVKFVGAVMLVIPRDSRRKILPMHVLMHLSTI